MGRASKRKRKQVKATGEDVLGVFYNQRGPLLFGAIAFAKHRSGSSESVPAYETSAPFVVSETLAPGEVVVHGSVSYLIRDIQRSIAEIYAKLNELDAAMSHVSQEAAVQGKAGRVVPVPESLPERRRYFEFRRGLAGELILLSTQARNLFDLFPRLDCRIPLYDSGGNRIGDIELSNLFVHFVHNQYLFLDGEHVSDLFPANPRPRAPISRTFMGYRFNWVEYVEAIKNAAQGVKVKDVIGLLRRRLNNLSLRSPYSDIVFLIQNLESFSMLLGEKLADERYQPVWSLLFEDETKALLKPKPKDGDAVRATITFDTPHVKIHERLSKKKFKVHVRCRWTLHGSNGQLLREDRDFRALTKEVGYDQLLAHVASAFGDDGLLGFRA